MVVKGFSIPVFAKYNYDAETKTVSYSDGMINPHGISYTVTVESTENNPLYGDNRIIENDTPRFNTGTLSLGVDGLDGETSKFILGVKNVEYPVGEGLTVSEEVWDDDQEIPVLGVGFIELHQNDDEDRYRAVILTKVKFNIPEQAANTKGDSVEWQTRTIEGTVSRSEQKDENYNHPWQMAAWFDTEDEALAYLKKKLSAA